MTRKLKVRGCRMFTPPENLSSLSESRVTNAPYRARDTSAALPMAKPLPTAAVVLPAASRASVFSRTCGVENVIRRGGGVTVEPRGGETHVVSCRAPFLRTWSFCLLHTYKPRVQAWGTVGAACGYCC